MKNLSIYVIDVYVSNYRIYPNNLFRNDGNGFLNNVAPTHNAEAGAGHSIGAAWGDFDNDGLFDLFAGNFAHSSQPQSRFLRNRGESADFQFEDLGQRGVYYQESYASPVAGDYDNDGNLDLYFTTVYWPGNWPALFRNDGSWNFTPVSDMEGLEKIGPTYQAAFADFDNDGDLDLLTDGRLFVNQGNSNLWLKVRLQGDGRHVNRAAIGAQVRIDTASRTLTRQVESGTGEGNQNELLLHFGLGNQNGPVDLHVNWPDGTEQTVSDVAVNQMVIVKYFQTHRADLNEDGRVDNKDYCILAQYWRLNEPSVDIAPQPVGDGKVDFKDLAFFVENWLTATTIPPLPAHASNPYPANGATAIASTVNLSWTAGTSAITHNVYIGTSNPPPFIRSVSTTTFVPGWLPYQTNLYWRIDEINTWGRTTGQVWEFSTVIPPPPMPGQATNPNPADGATGVSIDEHLSWMPGPGATSHDVYFGTSMILPFIRNQAAATFDPGKMDLGTKY